MGHKSSAAQTSFPTPLVGSCRFLTIQQFDPRLRLIVALVFAIVVVSLFHFTPLILALCLAFGSLLISHLPIRETLGKILLMDGFVLFLVLMLPFTTPGDPIFHVMGWGMSLEGFEKAALIALKTNAIVMMLLALVATMAPQQLGVALHHLKMPSNLVHLILFSVRYIDVLKQEYKRLRNSMKTRCFRPKNSFHTYRSIGFLVGMMIIRSLERSERILNAMKCRGFCGKFYILEKFQTRTRDYVGAGLFFLFCTFLILLEYGYVYTY